LAAEVKPSLLKFYFIFICVVCLVGLLVFGIVWYWENQRTWRKVVSKIEGPVEVTVEGVGDPAVYRAGYEFGRKWARADTQTREQMSAAMNAEAKNSDEKSWQAGFAKGVSDQQAEDARASPAPK